MSDLTEHDRIRLVEYFDGRIAPEAKGELEAWIAARPGRDAEVARLRLAWDVVGQTERGVWEDSLAFGRMRQERNGVALRVPQIGTMRGWGTQTLQRWVWPAATAIALGIIVIAAVWNTGMRYGGLRAPSSMMTYTTGNGERATIALPDGGTVTLNVASRLDVPMDYMAGHRALRLEGEGWFTVVHHEKTPMTVTAGATTARVLGTSFVVRHYATDTATLIAVRDGKVAVGNTVMTANQLTEVGRSRVPQIRSSNASLFTFATGTLTIDGLSLPAAIVELDRWYDADIRLGDAALASRHVQATFGAGSLGELAEILGLMYDVRVVRNGRVLTLYPRQ